MVDTHDVLAKTGDVAVAAIGNAAGATVDPKTGLAKLKQALARPRVLVVAALLCAAYLRGRSASR